MENLTRFTSSYEVRDHYMMQMKLKKRKNYMQLLSVLVKKELDDEHTSQRLKKLGTILLEGESIPDEDIPVKKLSKSVIKCRFKTGRRIKFCFLCDAAMILLDEKAVRAVSRGISEYLNAKARDKLDMFVSLIFGNDKIPQEYEFIKGSINSFREMLSFSQRKITKIIITATMSSGKSTLINALAGKRITRTSQEVCTGNICRIYNKSVEDGSIHLKSDRLIMNAEENDLRSFTWDKPVDIASYFHSFDGKLRRFCLIDTPGVNSALNADHANITHNAIKSGDYDKMVYILNANKLGTEEEIKSLKWVAENADRKKIIFILNKLDDFKSSEDNINESYISARNELIQLGFKDPVLCPVSAYFAYLIKQKLLNMPLDEDEEDEFCYFSKKFSKPMFDLSRYYITHDNSDSGNELVEISKKSGLYDLEKIIFE